MITLEELNYFFYAYFGEEFVQKAAEKDEFANGLQIAGKREITKIAFGVSLTEEFLKKAVRWGADAVVLHHGFDPKTFRARFPLPAQKRLRLIFKNDISVFGFHYLLDAHPEIGNSALIIKKLGAEIEDRFFNEWGYTGVFKNGQPIEKLVLACQKLFGRDMLVFFAGPKNIKRIGVATGAAKPYPMHLEEMLDRQVDLYISGETSEGKPDLMQEIGVNYFVCGHYATEVFAVKKLQELVDERLRVKTKFFQASHPF